MGVDFSIDKGYGNTILLQPDDEPGNAYAIESRDIAEMIATLFGIEFSEDDLIDALRQKSTQQGVLLRQNDKNNTSICDYCGSEYYTFANCPNCGHH